MAFEVVGNALVWRKLGETLRIEPWGEDALRVRATMNTAFTDKDWALTEPVPEAAPVIELYDEPWQIGDEVPKKHEAASIQNGRAKAVVNDAGVLSFFRDDELMLREYYRFYDGTISRESRCLRIVSRTWKGVLGGSEYSLCVRFESNDSEKIFGMGQYQHPYLDLKGTTLELAQRNSQASVPFALSSLGYGFLWNNPAVGEATFARNITMWEARATPQMDYWICVGDTPKEILGKYTAVTGRPPEFPEDLMGLWQCKLRYRTQDEVLEVARRYKRMGIHIDVIVVDFFHWTVQGDWKFDPLYWPDPAAMVRELHEMGTKAIVSVWPSVDRRSENFEPMMDRGLLIRTERGHAQTYDYQGDCVQIDCFNPAARAYVWEVCERNYRDLGFDGFWLDNTEPDFGEYDFEIYRYSERLFDDPMRAEGKPFANLALCVGGQPALCQRGLVGRRAEHLRESARPARGGPQHGLGRHLMVDDRRGRLHDRRRERPRLPPAPRALVRVRDLLGGAAHARRPRAAQHPRARRPRLGRRLPLHGPAQRDLELWARGRAHPAQIL